MEVVGFADSLDTAFKLIKSEDPDLVVDLWTTSTMAEKGFVDSYREVHPNTNNYPGITWDMADKRISIELILFFIREIN